MFILKVQKDFKWNGISYRRGETFNKKEAKENPLPSEVNRLLKDNYVYVDYFPEKEPEELEIIEPEALKKVNLDKISDAPLIPKKVKKDLEEG